MAAAEAQNFADEQIESKKRDQQAKELLEDEELSEEEVQRIMEKDEIYKMRKAVQAMRNNGDIQRYNSLKAKETKEDERIEQQVVDLNVKP